MVDEAHAPRRGEEARPQAAENERALLFENLQLAVDHRALARRILGRELGLEALDVRFQRGDFLIVACDLAVRVGAGVGDLPLAAQPGQQAGAGLDGGREEGSATGHILALQKLFEAVHQQLDLVERLQPALQVADVLPDVLVAADGVAQLADVDVLLLQQELVDELADGPHVLERERHHEGAHEALRVGVTPPGEQVPHVVADEVARGVGPRKLAAGGAAGLFEAAARGGP